MYQVEEDQRDDEHDPAGELMEEPERLVGVPVLDAEASAYDAGDVGSDCDRNGRSCEDDAAGCGALKKVAVKDGQGEETHERTDAATGFSNFQLHDGQLNDIAFLKCRHTKHGEDVACDARGQKLEWEGDLVEDDLWKRNRQKKNKQRETQFAQHGGAEEGPDQAGHEDDKGDTRGEEIDAVDAEDQNGDGEDDQRDSGP